MKPVTAIAIASIIFILLGCKKEGPNNNNRTHRFIPCYHLSPIKPVAYIQSGDTVIYSYDSLGKLMLAATFNGTAARQYSYTGSNSIVMNILPLSGDVYLSGEYYFSTNTIGAVNSLDAETDPGYSSNVLYNNVGQLDSLTWLQSGAGNGTPYQSDILDTSTYDSYGDLSGFSNLYQDFQVHYTITIYDKYTMTYYANQIYQVYDPEKNFLGILDFGSIDPQIFSKYLIASMSDSYAGTTHYYSYSRNNIGLISMVSDSTTSSVVKRYIYYDCQ